MRVREYSDLMGVNTLFVSDIINEKRGTTKTGKKIYTLEDIYPHADLVTYPSLWEGWGNQFLEAVKAKLPLLLFEYPVYIKDIKDKGFQVISLGNQIRDYDEDGLARVESLKIEEAADQAIILLTDAEQREQVVEHNFEVGLQHYSMEALKGYLEPLFTD